MAVSFGLGKKIIEHPSYNLGLALPFIAAFYLLNDSAPVALPFIGYAFGPQLSILLKILLIAFVYSLFLFTFVLAGGLSVLPKESKLRWAIPVPMVVLSVVGFHANDGNPKFGLVFAVLAALFILLMKFDKGQLSLLLVGATGLVIALTSFVAGILWFEGQFAFQSAVTNLFGFATLSAESLKIGWAMLITTGYSIYYAVFQTGEAWGDLLSTQAD
jgi:hypothetical protein